MPGRGHASCADQALSIPAPMCLQAQQYEWLQQDYPRLFAEIQQAEKGGQFVPVGGKWLDG